MDSVRKGTARRSRSKCTPTVALPTWYFPVLGILAHIFLLVLVGLLALGYTTSPTTVVVFLGVLAFPVWLYVHIEFISLVVDIVSGTLSCDHLRADFALYELVALQSAQALVYVFLFYENPETSFSGVCGAAEGVTPSDCSPFLVVARLFYYSAVTFVSVGYGDIAPQSLLASLWVLPELWAPIFYLAILISKIVGSSANSVQ